MASINTESVWRGSRVVLPEPKSEVCPYGAEFAEWAGSLLEDTDLANPVRIHQSLVLLLIQYYRWYYQVPRSHQIRVSEHGHLCIFHVFMRTADELMSAHIKLNPPVCFPAPPPPQPELPLQIAGIFLGEEVNQ